MDLKEAEAPQYQPREDEKREAGQTHPAMTGYIPILASATTWLVKVGTSGRDEGSRKVRSASRRAERCDAKLTEILVGKKEGGDGCVASRLKRAGGLDRHRKVRGGRSLGCCARTGRRTREWSVLKAYPPFSKATDVRVAGWRRLWLRKKGGKGQRQAVVSLLRCQPGS